MAGLLVFKVGLTLGLLLTGGLVASAQTGETAFEAERAQAEAARAAGDRVLALQLYAKALEADPQWAEGWFVLGTLHYGADEFAPARDALSHLIEVRPDATAALALRGLCEFETGEYKQSLDDLQRGIALGAANQPRNAQIVLYHEALLLTKLGRFDEAIGKYLVFVKQTPETPDLEVAVGLAGMRMALLPKEVEASQADLLTMVGQGSISVMTGDLAGAQKEFQVVFDRNPAMPNVHYLYGYLLFAAHSDQADAQFRQEIAIAPKNAAAHAMLAWSLEFQGDYAGALGDARDAVNDDPGLSFGQMVYARALIETGDVDQGFTHLQSVLRDEPKNLEAHMTLAKAYSKLGRVEDARKERLLCLQMSDELHPGGAALANP